MESETEFIPCELCRPTDDGETYTHPHCCDCGAGASCDPFDYCVCE